MDWTKSKPSAPGAYWVRGYHKNDIALVEVSERDGELCSNIHCINTAKEDHFGPVEMLSDLIEWCGPLHY